MREVKSYYQGKEKHDAFSEEAVDNALAVLLSKKILIEENGQYLSLAYRLKDIVHRLPTKARVFIANTQQYRSYKEGAEDSGDKTQAAETAFRIQDLDREPAPILAG
jgi:hypothetical protein